MPLTETAPSCSTTAPLPRLTSGLRVPASASSAALGRPPDAAPVFVSFAAASAPVPVAVPAAAPAMASSSAAGRPPDTAPASAGCWLQRQRRLRLLFRWPSSGVSSVWSGCCGGVGFRAGCREPSSFGLFVVATVYRRDVRWVFDVVCRRVGWLVAERREMCWRCSCIATWTAARPWRRSSASSSGQLVVMLLIVDPSSD